ncbi:MAG: hypothetical protein K6G27_02835 [Lachnospiraceae bacterium]|nr:hypothetical protein [Lachnospiraceae bacterium]
MMVGRSIDIQRTRDYYKQLSFDDLCQCDYCKNYVKEVKAAYPRLAKFLDSLGIDIEKPFETSYSDPETGRLEYFQVMYVAFGNPDGWINTEVDGVKVYITRSGPANNIKEDHFVIALSSVILKCEEMIEEKSDIHEK